MPSLSPARGRPHAVAPPDASTPAEARCTLRIVANRPCEPHYDDDVSADGPPSAVDGALALTFAPARRALDVDDDTPPGPLAGRPTSAWIGRLVQALTEVLAGDRPITQLAGHLSPGVYLGIERRLLRQPAPRQGNRPSALSAVRSVHVREPRRGALEVAAVVRRGERMAAIALRLEASGDGWRCTALHVG